MPQASGVFKQVAIKKETTYGTLPTASAAQLLRRVSSAFNLQKDTFRSNEIRTTFQRLDMRHGTRRVAGNISGELAPGSYAPYLGSMLKRDFAAVSAITGASITIAASGSNYTVTRAAGSFITDGVRIGHVIRLTAGSFNANNLNKNLLVITLTATVATVRPLNSLTMTAEGPIASATVTVAGKSTFVPQSGHTDDSYAVEEWYSDISRSEVFVGNKWTRAALDLPPSGIATISLDAMGKGFGQAPSGSRYFTSPTAAGTSGVVAAVNGVLTVGGNVVTTVTGLNVEIAAGFSGDPTVGADSVSSLFAGPVDVSGQFSCYFEDGVIPGYFYDETEIALVLAMTASSAANAEFFSLALPRIKVGGADKNDGEGGVVRTFPFTALENATSGANELTTIFLHDSLAA